MDLGFDNTEFLFQVEKLRQKKVIGFVGHGGRHILAMSYSVGDKKQQFKCMCRELITHMIDKGKIEYIFGKEEYYE